MATTTSLSPSAQQVVAALQALATPTAANGDRSIQLAANDWLTSFQHSVRTLARCWISHRAGLLTISTVLQKDAWETCHVLLFDESVGLDVKMFAGQTFRAKVRRLDLRPRASGPLS